MAPKGLPTAHFRTERGQKMAENVFFPTRTVDRWGGPDPHSGPAWRLSVASLRLQWAPKPLAMPHWGMERGSEMCLPARDPRDPPPGMPTHTYPYPYPRDPPPGMPTHMSLGRVLRVLGVLGDPPPGMPTHMFGAGGTHCLGPHSDGYTRMRPLQNPRRPHERMERMERGLPLRLGAQSGRPETLQFGCGYGQRATAEVEGGTSSKVESVRAMQKPMHSTWPARH